MNPSATRPWPVSPHYSTCDDVDVDDIIDDDDEPEEKWHVQVAEGDVRVVSLEKLDDLFRFDVIDQNTFVWKPGMSNWVRLSSLLGTSEPEQEDEFHVLFSPGNVRTLSLEQLDEFYRHSIIDEGTMVWRTGMHEWQTLGRVAGIDEAVLSTHPAPSAAPALARPNTAVSAYAKTALPNVPPLSARPAQAAPPSARGAQPANTGFPNVPPPSTRAAQAQRTATVMPSVPPPSARAPQAQRTTAPVPIAPSPSARAVQPANTVSASAPPTSARVAGGNAHANPARGAQYPNTGVSAQAASAYAAQYANTFAHTSPPASTRAVQYASSAAPVGSAAYARPQAAVSPGFVPSAPPVSFAVEPYAAAPRSRGGRWLLRFAVVVGALLALIQNDVIYGAIEKTPLAAQYESAERSLFGGPVFGTTRSVDRFIATTSSPLEPVRLPIAVTQFIDGQKHGSSSAQGSSDTGTVTTQASTPKSDTATQPSQGSSTNATSRSDSSTSTTTTSTPTDANSSAKAHAVHEKSGHANSSERPSSKASTHKAAPPAPGKKASAPSGTKSGVKAGGSYYDPLNGAL